MVSGDLTAKGNGLKWQSEGDREGGNGISIFGYRSKKNTELTVSGKWVENGEGELEGGNGAVFLDIEAKKKIQENSWLKVNGLQIEKGNLKEEMVSGFLGTGTKNTVKGQLGKELQASVVGKLRHKFEK